MWLQRDSVVASFSPVFADGHHCRPRRRPETRPLWQLLARSRGIFANHFELTLREIEKTFSIAAIYFSSSSPSRFSNRFENEWLVALLSILKIKNPEIYALLDLTAAEAAICCLRSVNPRARIFVIKPTPQQNERKNYTNHPRR
jgi:hypothetical protein